MALISVTRVGKGGGVRWRGIAAESLTGIAPTDSSYLSRSPRRRSGATRLARGASGRQRADRSEFRLTRRETTSLEAREMVRKQSKIKKKKRGKEAKKYITHPRYRPRKGCDSGCPPSSLVARKELTASAHLKDWRHMSKNHVEAACKSLWELARPHLNTVHPAKTHQRRAPNPRRNLSRRTMNFYFVDIVCV